jgi:ferredoxin
MTRKPANNALHIDWTRCDGRGFCAELLASRLTRDQWGYPLAIGAGAGERTNVPIPDNQLEAAEDAVNLCPRLALSLRRIT